MELSNTEKRIFAMLFASGKPLEFEKIVQVTGTSVEETRYILENMEKKLTKDEFPVQLIKLNDSYQLVTHRNYAEDIKEVLASRKNARLSPAALEVLAVIAYNQPVSKSFIEQIRGVDSSGIVNSLLEKELIEEDGRLDVPGRPIAYRTSENFLRCFGLSSLEELPDVREQ